MAVGDGLRAAADEHVEFDERLTALEDASDLEPRDQIVYDGLRDQTLDDFRITLEPGDPRKWAVILRDCHRVKIEDFKLFGGGIYVVGGSDIEIGSGLIERNRPGDIAAKDAESGVFFFGTERALLHTSVVAYGDCNVRAEAVSGLMLDSNFTYNPRGPRWRGQHVQAGWYEGQRSQGITILSHYALTDFTRPGDFEGARTMQEDAFNFGSHAEVRIEDVFSEMRGHKDGYGSPSGTGLLFEGGTGSVDGFTSIGHANVGWSVAARAEVSIRNALSFHDGQGEEGFRPSLQASGQVAGACWQRSFIDIGPNVRCYGTKRDGSVGDYWLERGKATQTGELADRGHYMSANAVAARETLVRPAIPDVGFEFP